MTEANNEAKAFELIELETYSNPSSFNRDQAKNELDKHLVIQVGVFGSGGEYVQMDDLGDLNTAPLPHNISRIEINNTTIYKMIRKRDPVNQFKVVLDFKSPKVFDLSSSPTSATANDSQIEVLGKSETWVDGTYSSIKKIFDEARSRVGFVHWHGVYDILLWFFYVPLITITLFRFDKIFSDNLGSTSAALQVVIYLNLLVIALYLFRFLFNYARWLFPYFELEFQKEKNRNAQRALYLLFVGGLACSAVYDAFKYLLFDG